MPICLYLLPDQHRWGPQCLYYIPWGVTTHLAPATGFFLLLDIHEKSRSRLTSWGSAVSASSGTSCLNLGSSGSKTWNKGSDAGDLRTDPRDRWKEAKAYIRCASWFCSGQKGHDSANISWKVYKIYPESSAWKENAVNHPHWLRVAPGAWTPQDCWAPRRAGSQCWSRRAQWVDTLSTQSRLCSRKTVHKSCNQ